MNGRVAPPPACGTYSTIVLTLECQPYGGLLVEALAALLTARQGSLGDLRTAGGYGRVVAEFVLKGGAVATSSLDVRITAPHPRRHDGTGGA